MPHVISVTDNLTPLHMFLYDTLQAILQGYALMITIHEIKHGSGKECECHQTYM